MQAEGGKEEVIYPVGILSRAEAACIGFTLDLSLAISKKSSLLWPFLDIAPPSNKNWWAKRRKREKPEGERGDETKEEKRGRRKTEKESWKSSRDIDSLGPRLWFLSVLVIRIHRKNLIIRAFFISLFPFEEIRNHRDIYRRKRFFEEIRKKIRWKWKKIKRRCLSSYLERSFS